MRRKGKTAGRMVILMIRIRKRRRGKVRKKGEEEERLRTKFLDAGLKGQEDSRTILYG